MSWTEDDSGTTGGPVPPPEPADAPTEVGLPVPPPRPPESRTSVTVIAVIALLLVAVVGLAAILAFDLFGTRPDPAATVSPIAAASPAAPDATTLATSPATAPAAAPPSPAAASPDQPAGTPTAAPTDPQHDLLNHIPADLRARCELGPGTPPALAVASCQADGGQILATYFMYDDEQAMETAYDGFVELSGIERNSGRCSEPETWPSEGSYSVSQQPVGRVLCMQNADAPTIYWTDDRLLILTWAFHLQADAERLYEFWQGEAGPSP